MSKMSIIMSNGCGFLWVIRVLETVGPQIGVVGPRKWSGCSHFSIIVTTSEFTAPTAEQ